MSVTALLISDKFSTVTGTHLRRHSFTLNRPGMHGRGPDSAPERVLSGPPSRLKNIRNVSWITEILWMI